MTTKKKKIPGKGGARKLKLKKETVRDLDAKRRGAEVKGGLGFSVSPTCLATCNCFTKTCPPCRL